MADIILDIVLFVVGVGAGFLVLMKFFRDEKFFDYEKNKKNSEEKVLNAQKEADELIHSAKEKVTEKKKNLDTLLTEKKDFFERKKAILDNKEGILNNRETRNEQLRSNIKSLEKETNEKKTSLGKLGEEALDLLAKKSGDNLEKVKKDLLSSQVRSLEVYYQEKSAKDMEDFKDKVDKIAVRVILNVAQRLSSPSTTETRAVHISVPRDNIKGKIVGKSGRNIHYFESKLNVDVVFNDLPNTISVSAFNLVDRRIAQQTLNYLVKYKGDIDEKVIDDCITKARASIDKELYLIGKKGLDQMGVKSEPEEFCKIVGRLQYRTSYGQNILKHSMEVGWVSAMIGAEIGLDEKTCLVGGFLHDVGKAIDQQEGVEDTHDLLSKEIMEKFGFSWEEVHAAWTHHDAIPQETPEAVIVKAADAISASRPGARAESFEKYLERMRELESIAKETEGVWKAYAISAGRELRVFVDSEKVVDQKLSGLARKLADQIEEELVYPGQVKVNVVRRTRHTELANL